MVSFGIARQTFIWRQKKLPIKEKNHVKLLLVSLSHTFGSMTVSGFQHPYSGGTGRFNATRKKKKVKHIYINTQHKYNFFFIKTG